MTQYIFLYVGPNAADVGVNRPPLSQAALDQWAGQAGTAIVDRGAVFGIDSVRVDDTKSIYRGSLPLYGYSVVQGENPADVLALARNHPFLAVGGGGNFEIQIIEITAGERPLDSLLDPANSALLAASISAPAPAGLPQAPVPAAPAAPLPQPSNQTPPVPEQPTGQVVEPQASPQTPGELTVPHDETPEQQIPGNPQPPQPGAPL